MTRDEITKLLEFVCAAYPNAKINDPAGTASVWEMAFGEYPAESVYRAARLYMDSSAFFPTIADIKKFIPRAEIIISSENKKLMPNVEQVKKIESKASGNDFPEYGSDEWLEDLCKFVGFGYPCDLDY